MTPHIATARLPASNAHQGGAEMAEILSQSSSFPGACVPFTLTGTTFNRRLLGVRGFLTHRVVGSEVSITEWGDGILALTCLHSHVVGRDPSFPTMFFSCTEGRLRAHFLVSWLPNLSATSPTTWPSRPGLTQKFPKGRGIPRKWSHLKI